jgi:hypothetical protein
MDSNNADHMDWKSHLESSGFHTDREQITKARRAEGPFTGIGNIIFYRDGDGTEADTEAASV